MSKISINLLPSDLIIHEIEEKKRSVKITICIVAITIFIMLSLTLLFLRFLQNQDAQGVNNSLNSTTSIVKSLKSEESALTALRNRLDIINQILKNESLEVTAYSTLLSLTASQVSITGFTIDKKGKVLVSLESSSIRRLQQVLDKLSDPPQTNSRISNLIVDGISKTRTDLYKADVTLSFK